MIRILNSFALAMLSIAACSTSHKVEVAPTHHTVEIKPIYLTIDVNIRVQKELDTFFEDVAAPEEKEGEAK